MTHNLGDAWRIWLLAQKRTPKELMALRSAVEQVQKEIETERDCYEAPIVTGRETLLIGFASLVAAGTFIAQLLKGQLDIFLLCILAICVAAWITKACLERKFVAARAMHDFDARLNDCQEILARISWSLDHVETGRIEGAEIADDSTGDWLLSADPNEIWRNLSADQRHRFGVA